MRLYLDTNVLLDLYFPGRGGKDLAKRVIDIGTKPFSVNRLSSLSLANIAYVLRKTISREETKKCIQEINSVCSILDLGSMDILRAIRSSCPDFEDALQIACAEGQCDVIITNDKKHFEGHTWLPVYTPQEFLDDLEKHQQPRETS